MGRNIQSRFITIVGTIVRAIATWESPQACKTGSNYHRAVRVISKNDVPFNISMEMPDVGQFEEFKQEEKVCERCGEKTVEHASYATSMGPQWSTESGTPEPGDVYFSDHYDCKENGRCVWGWTNCSGQHLMAILPNGRVWDVDGRANNCGSPDEHTHRCWVRHGDEPPFHVDKEGHTCTAGAGSIWAGDWHGFFHNGEFREC